MEQQGYQTVLTVESSDVKSSMRQTTSAVPDNSMFQSAPVLSSHFEAAISATDPLDKKPIAAPTPPPPRVSAMGVDV
jgi:hypothetical protein